MYFPNKSEGSLQQLWPEERAVAADGSAGDSIQPQEDEIRALAFETFDSTSKNDISPSLSSANAAFEAPALAQSATAANDSGAHEAVPGEAPARPKAKVYPRRKAGQTSAGRQPGQDPLVLEYNDLVPYFKLSQQQACKELDIGLSTMKRLCRKFGIKRWPGPSSQSRCTCTSQGKKSVAHDPECLLACDGGAHATSKQEEEAGPVPSFACSAKPSSAAVDTGKDFDSGIEHDLMALQELEGTRSASKSPLREAEGVSAVSEHSTRWKGALDDEWPPDHPKKPSP